MEACLKRISRTTRRNPLARAVKRLRPKVIRPKRGKGAYRRKSRRSERAVGREDEAESGGRR